MPITPPIHPPNGYAQIYYQVLRKAILVPMALRMEECVKSADQNYKAIRQDILNIPQDPSLQGFPSLRHPGFPCVCLIEDSCSVIVSPPVYSHLPNDSVSRNKCKNKHVVT